MATLFAVTLVAAAGVPVGVAQQADPPAPAQTAPDTAGGNGQSAPRADAASGNSPAPLKQFVPSRPLSSDKSVSFPVDI